MNVVSRPLCRTIPTDPAQQEVVRDSTSFNDSRLFPQWCSLRGPNPYSCLRVKRFEADVQRTPDVTATISGGTQYVLVNITLSGDRATTNGTGTSLGALIAQSVNMYRLDDSAGSEIAPHVGERVEVTGALVNEPEAPTGTSGRRDQLNSIAKSPLLKIQSFRTISADSASCAR